MNALVNTDETTPSVAMKLLVEKHGSWAVLRALAATLLPKRRVAVRLDDLKPAYAAGYGAAAAGAASQILGAALGTSLKG